WSQHQWVRTVQDKAFRLRHWVADSRRGGIRNGHGGCNRLDEADVYRWCVVRLTAGPELGGDQSGGRIRGRRGGLWEQGGGRAGDRGGRAGVPRLARVVRLRPGQGFEKDSRA